MLRDKIEGGRSSLVLRSDVLSIEERRGERGPFGLLSQAGLHEGTLGWEIRRPDEARLRIPMKAVVQDV